MEMTSSAFESSRALRTFCTIMPVSDALAPIAGWDRDPVPGRTLVDSVATLKLRGPMPGRRQRMGPFVADCNR
jgi:hypothetical protein